jgi:hypothetical protein
VRLVTTLISLLGMSGTAKAELDISRCLWAVRMVENADVRFVSKSGARGIYQIRPAVWMQYSDKPLEWANSEDPTAIRETYRVAMAHARWIFDKAIPTLKLSRTPYTFGLVWLAGYGNVERLNLSPANVSFAKRLTNLYESDN